MRRKESNKVFAVIIAGVMEDDVYQSLNGAADRCGFSYNTVAKKWNRSYTRGDVTIRELNLIRMRNRGRHVKK